LFLHLFNFYVIEYICFIGKFLLKKRIKVLKNSFSAKPKKRVRKNSRGYDNNKARRIQKNYSAPYCLIREKHLHLPYKFIFTKT